MPSLIFLVVLVLTVGCGRIWYDDVPAGWWDDSFGARLRFEIPPGTVGEDLLEFPLQVSLHGAPLDRMDSAGRDLRFVDVDEGILLQHELTTIDISSGRLHAWVSIPRIYLDMPTRFHLYFDNPAATATADPQSVWRGHRAVWHLDTGPELPIADATGSGSVGSSTGDMAVADLVSGPGDRAVDCDGVDDGISVEGGPAIDTADPITVTLWARSRTFAENEGLLLARAETYGSDSHDFYLRASAGCLNAGIYNGAGFGSGCVDWDDTGAWHHISLVVARGLMQLYFDGTPEVERPYTGTMATSGYPIHICHWGVVDGTRSWDGAIDEVWMAAAARSPAWIAALHASQSGTTFYVMSSLESLD